MEVDLIQLIKLIPTCLIVMFALAIAHHEARPYEAESATDQPQESVSTEQEASDSLRSKYEGASHQASAPDCLLQLDDDQTNCKDSANAEAGAKWPPRVVTCLTSCANCVR